MGFQITGAAVLLVFYGCYFGKMAAQRKKGIRTDQMGREKTGLERAVELAVKAAAWGVAAAEMVSIFLNTGIFASPVRSAGALAAVLGTAVFIVSAATMEDSWRAGVSKTEKTALVTRGVYQISRNPAFLGFDLLYIGVGVMFFNWMLFVLSVFAAVMLHTQIVKVEEPFLAETFGERYLAYRKRVCRYLGRKRR